MTTFLRRPYNLAQGLNIRPQTNICPSCISRITRHESLATTSRGHFYSTGPQDQTPSRLDQSKKEPVNKARGGSSKPARGFENLFSHGSALSFARTSARRSDPKHGEETAQETSKLPEGRVQLTELERQGLEEVLKQVRKTFPTSQIEQIEKVVQSFEKVGIPKEFREIMDSVRQGKKLDMATAWKLLKIMKDQADTATEQYIRDEHQEDKSKEKSKQQSDSKKDESKKATFTIGGTTIDVNTFLTACLAGYMLYKVTMPGENSREISFQEFKTTFLDKGLVEKLSVVNKSTVKVDLHREAVGRLYPESPAQHANFRYYFTIGSVESFERKLDEAQEDLGIPSAQRIPVKYVGESAWFNTFLAFGPTALFVGLLYWMSRRGGSGGGTSGIFSMGKSKARKFNHETDLKIRFQDVAGMDEAKQEIMEFVSFLKEPGQYQKLGAKIPRGALLSGPPGTGKTMLAKATAGESGVPFFSISGSEFVEIFVGVGASRVRDLFRTAKKSTPCIIFIDEIDAVGKSRAKSTGFGGNDEREGTLNQILTEMDGFDTSDQVVVLAGTNRPDVLDKALLRPGRFDRHISIDAPTMEGRKQIFKVHLAKITTNEDVDYLTGRLAALTPGFSGADVANCVNEAALIAARSTADAVKLTHFEQAIERVIGGLEKRSLVLNPEEKKTVAYHEAGHAICGWFFKYADPLLKVSIIPRGQGALGYAQYLPPGDMYLMSSNQLMDRMAMALGGRVSEEIHFDAVTSGASDDFNKVTRMATAMVTKWGMSSKMGYVYFDDSQQELKKPFSEHTAQEIDSEVRRIVDEALAQCRNLLQEKKKEVGLVAEELLKKEVLDRDDMVRLLGKRPFADNKEFEKYFGENAEAPPPSLSPSPSEAPPPPNPAGGVAAIRRSDWERLDVR